MKVFLVSYDLRGAEDSDSYKLLIDALKAYPYSYRPLYSQWYIVSPDDAEQVCANLEQYIDVNDRLLVHEDAFGGWYNSNNPEFHSEMTEERQRRLKRCGI